MDQNELEEKWKEMVAPVFDQFIKENFGYTESNQPSCYGTGNSEPWCLYCIDQGTC